MNIDSKATDAHESTSTSASGLIDYLLSHGLLSDDQLKIIDYELSHSDQPIAPLLTRLGFISEATLRDAMGESLGQQGIDLSSISVDPEAIDLVPRALAQRHTFLPLSWDAQTLTLTLAIADSSDLLAQDKLMQVLPPKTQLIMRLASVGEINTAIDLVYGYKLDIDGVLEEIETGKIDLQALESNNNYSQPTVRLIDAIVIDAVKREASDIHFEPESDFLRIRYRIDGVLRQIRVLHKSYWSAMVVRIKVISHMNIAEVRSPQDGHMSMNVRGYPVDFRVSILPTIHGENIVMRILDRYHRDLTLHNIGATQTQQALLERLISRPEGIIIVSGPTGSGKTTTLYAMLMHINKETINIMTLEDPVEYPISMIRQTSVTETVKVDFAEGIRSMMRQDPDVILVGEIRDAETTEMSFRAAMTGHQVYTTLHTNSAIGIFPRLMDIGISSQILSGNVIGAVAQRLIRKLCVHCKHPIPVPDYIKSFINVDEIFTAEGCKACDFTGYKGRTGIFEILVINDELDLAIAEGKSAIVLGEIAKKNGFIPLLHDGFARLEQGVTSLDEVARNTDLTRFIHASSISHQP